MWYNVRMSSLSTIARFACALLAAASLSGCFSLERTRIEQAGGEHVLASNYGWYLFHVIPLACGNAREERWTPWVLFRDDVKMDKVQKRFTDYAARQGCDIEDMTYKNKESVMFEIPSLNFPLPVPYLLTYREIQLSGVMIPKDRDAAGKEAGR